MANILLLTLGIEPSTAEATFVSRVNLTHTVTTLQSTSFTTAAEAGIDALWIGQSISALNNADAVGSALPVLIMGTQSPSEFGLCDFSGQTFAGETQIEILDAANPLSASLSLGLNTVFNNAYTIQRTNGVAPAGKVAYRQPTANTNYTLGYYFDQGDLLYDGVSTAAGDRVTVFGSTSQNFTESNLTTAGLAVFDAAINQIVGGVVVTPKLEGTLTPWDTQVPAANLTGVKYSVRSDLQTSDNQVLSGTTTTNASGQFSIEDAALSPATTYYVTFENAAGTVFATHKITTD